MSVLVTRYFFFGGALTRFELLFGFAENSKKFKLFVGELTVK